MQLFASTYSLMVVYVTRHIVLTRVVGIAGILKSAMVPLCVVSPQSKRSQLGGILGSGGFEAAIGILGLISQYLPSFVTCTCLCMQLAYPRFVFLPFFCRYAGCLQAKIWIVRFVDPGVISKRVVEFSGRVAECAHVRCVDLESAVKTSICKACSKRTAISGKTVGSYRAGRERSQGQQW